MLAICSYSLEKCDSFELLNVISNHQFALIRRNGKWEIIESSERKRMEEALQQNEENFKALAENANDGILIGTGDGGWHVYANRRAVEITGYSIEELLKTCIKDLVSPGEFAKLIERYKKRLVGLEVPKPYETTLVKKDGINVSIEISPSKTIWQNQLADMVIFRDITERKKAEETLRLNEEKLRKVIDSSPNTITVSDLNGIIIDCNQAAADMHGFSTKEDIIGKNALEFFAPKDREKVMEHFKKTLESGSVKNVEYTLLKKDGSEFPAELSASVIQDSSGKPLSFVGITKDITERKQAEKKLQESEKKFKTIADVAKEGIIMMDSKGEVSYWNEAAEKIFGYTSEEILGKSLHMVLAPKRFHELYYKGFEKFKETGTGAAVGKTLELAGIKKDATEFPLELSLSSVMIQNQWHAVGIARDISERKRTEESLKGKIDELERYKKVTVNREMKMIELKKKITELEEKSMKR
jgi:PAS domain S-box-containing protein